MDQPNHAYLTTNGLAGTVGRGIRGAKPPWRPGCRVATGLVPGTTKHEESSATKATPNAKARRAPPLSSIFMGLLRSALTLVGREEGWKDRVWCARERGADA